MIAAVAAGIDANSAEVTRIAAGDHTMLLTKDGKIYVSGKNDAGQLGIGADSEMKECAMAPEKVSDERWLDCASGYYHSTAVKADGTLWA